jgi:hypothetical protein
LTVRWNVPLVAFVTLIAYVTATWPRTLSLSKPAAYWRLPGLGVTAR